MVFSTRNRVVLKTDEGEDRNPYDALFMLVYGWSLCDKVINCNHGRKARHHLSSCNSKGDCSLTPLLFGFCFLRERTRTAIARPLFLEMPGGRSLILGCDQLWRPMATVPVESIERQRDRLQHGCAELPEPQWLHARQRYIMCHYWVVSCKTKINRTKRNMSQLRLKRIVRDPVWSSFFFFFVHFHSARCFS